MVGQVLIRFLTSSSTVEAAAFLSLIRPASPPISAEASAWSCWGEISRRPVEITWNAQKKYPTHSYVQENAQPTGEPEIYWYFVWYLQEFHWKKLSWSTFVHDCVVGNKPPWASNLGSELTTLGTTRFLHQVATGGTHAPNVVLSVFRVQYLDVDKLSKLNPSSGGSAMVHSIILMKWMF